MVHNPIVWRRRPKSLHSKCNYSKFLKFLIRKQAALLPEQEQSIHLLRLKDWLRLLGFTMDRGYFGCYAPLCKTSRWIERWSFMEKAGNRWWPFAGAVYMLQAIKRVRGMHLIGPAWRNKRLRNRLAIPATHSSHSVSNNKNHD